MCHEHRPGFKHTPLAQQQYHYRGTFTHKFILQRGSSYITSSLSEFAAESLLNVHSIHNTKQKVTLYVNSALFVAIGLYSSPALLGTPPSPDGEAHRRRRSAPSPEGEARRRRRSAPSEEADERRSVPRRQRGWTRGARSEAYQTKA